MQEEFEVLDKIKKSLNRHGRNIIRGTLYLALCVVCYLILGE